MMNFVCVLLALLLPFLKYGSSCVTPRLVAPSNPEDFALSMETPALGFPIYTINDIHIDFGEDECVANGFVRVDLFLANGTGSLSLGRPDLADFSSCVFRHYPGQQGSNWYCRGNGTGRNMTFITAKRDVDLVFSNMTFTPYFRKYQEDKISIRVYDGEGGPCLNMDEHELYGQPPLKMRCTKTSASFRTPKYIDAKNVEEDRKHNGFLATAQFIFLSFLNKNEDLVLGVSIALIVVIFGGIGLFYRHQWRTTKDDEEPLSEDPIVNEDGVIGPFDNQDDRLEMLEWANKTFGTNIDH